MTDTTTAAPGDLVACVYDAGAGHLRAANTGETKGRRGDFVWLGGNAYAHADLAPMLGPIDKLIEHPENPRHGDLAAITASIRTNGLYRPAYAQRSTAHVLAGNHTTKAVRDLGGQLMPRVLLDVDDKAARKILLADNRTADLGRYDEALLLGMLRDLEAEQELLGTGYTADDLTLLAEVVDAAEADSGDEADNRAPTTSEMLAVVDVTWGEPLTRPHHGQVWRLGPHLLVIAKLHTEHQLWRHLLDDEHVFAPYPEPYLTTSELAGYRPLLMVQPNTYLAGHLIDKHRSTHPDDVVEQLEAGE